MKHYFKFFIVSLFFLSKSHASYLDERYGNLPSAQSRSVIPLSSSVVDKDIAQWSFEGDFRERTGAEYYYSAINRDPSKLIKVIELKKHPHSPPLLTFILRRDVYPKEMADHLQDLSIPLTVNEIKCVSNRSYFNVLDAPDINSSPVTIDFYTENFMLKVKDLSHANNILKYFYEKAHIADEVIDRLVSLRIEGIDDFRVGSEAIIEGISQLCIEEKDNEDIINYSVKRLSLITDRKYYERTCLELAIFLQDNVDGMQQFIFELLSEVTDSESPCYAEAKLFIAHNVFYGLFQFSGTLSDYYRTTITTTLEAHTHAYTPELKMGAQNLGNCQTKEFLSSHTESVELSDQLKDLVISADRMFDTLDIVRQKNYQISLLNSEIDRLESLNRKLVNLIYGS